MTKDQRKKLRMLFGGKCAYCGCDLPEKGWHADHVEPIIRKTVRDLDAAKKGILKFKQSKECHYPELDVIENLVPACRACNIYKSCSGVEEFRRTITRVAVNSLDRTQSLRAAKRFGILEIDDSPITFWFEKYKHNLKQDEQ